MLFSKQDIYTDDGRHYMRRWRVGRLCLHIIYQGDPDPDAHDHPWDFWTFPLVPYVERVVSPAVTMQLHADREVHDRTIIPPSDKTVRVELVPAFKISKRPAEHTHRIIGRWNGYSVTKTGYEYRGAPATNAHVPCVGEGKIVTIVWRSKPRRNWGFVKNRDNLWCWSFWKDYLSGERHSGCE